MHSTKSSSFFAINHDDNHKFSFKFACATECKYTCEGVFCIRSWVYLCIKVESYIHKIHKIPKSSGLCLVSNFDWQDFKIHFMIFKWSFLNVISITIILLAATYYLISIRFYIDITILIDFATAFNHFFDVRTKATELSLRIFTSWLHQNCKKEI